MLVAKNVFYKILDRMFKTKKVNKDVKEFSKESLIQSAADDLQITKKEITQLSKNQKYLKQLRVNLVPAYKLKNSSMNSDSRIELLKLIYLNEQEILHGKKKLTQLFAKQKVLKAGLRKLNSRVRRVEYSIPECDR